MCSGLCAVAKIMSDEKGCQKLLYFAGDDVPCNIEDVLVFCSGSEQVPPLGYEKPPTIAFEYQSVLATASTCDIQLRLPICHGTNYSSFRNAIIESLKSNDVVF